MQGISSSTAAEVYGQGLSTIINALPFNPSGIMDIMKRHQLENVVPTEW